MIDNLQNKRKVVKIVHQESNSVAGVDKRPVSGPFKKLIEKATENITQVSNRRAIRPTKKATLIARKKCGGCSRNK